MKLGLFGDRARTANRLATRIGQMVRRRGQQVEGERKDAYKRLLGVAKASRMQAGKV